MRLLSLLLLATLAPAVLGGCEEAIAPVPELGAAVTLWGALDPRADTQAVRVVRISPDLDPYRPDPIGAAVTTTHLATGEQVAWRDSLVDFGDGRFGHVYLAPFRPAFGETYRLDVALDEGRTARATVEVPELIEGVVRPTRFAAPNRPFLRTFWPGGYQLNGLRVRYYLEGGDCERFYHTIPYRGPYSPVEFGYEVEVDLAGDAERLIRELEMGRLAAVEITLEVEVANERWRPRGLAFDPDLLLDPEGFTNVEGGYGFVGAAYRTALTWTPNPAEAFAAGFQAIGSCG